MMSLRFARQFLMHPRQLGTFTESGRVLARTMAQEINGNCRVVEFGAGTGVVTREILKRLSENGYLTCFEINRDFCRCLEQIGDPRLRVINDDARNCERYMDYPDCVISGLPLTLFGKPEKEQILAISSRSGTYIQLQYTPVLSKEIRRYFSDVKLKFVPRNLPPAFVYVCRHPRNTGE
jgi:phospholipid N-methyltransferase